MTTKHRNAYANRTKHGVRKTEKVGNVQVTYRPVLKGGRRYWSVVDYRTGKRVVRNCSSEEDAKALAREIAQAISKGKQAVNDLSSQDAFLLQQIREALGEGVNPMDAVNFYVRHGAHHVDRRSVEEAVQAYLAVQKAKVSQAHYGNVRGRLELFAKAVTGHVMDVTPDQIETWIGTLDAGAVTKNNYLKSICAFFNWCSKRRFAPQGFNPASSDSVDRLEEDDAEIVVWSHDEARTILARLEADKEGFDLIPAFALGCFAGLRISEIERLGWQQVREACASGWLRLQGRDTKTGKARMVPISVNLKLWLLPHLGKSGSVVPDWAMTETPAHISRITGLQWKNNASRHSFGSYRYAVTQNIGQVSKEMGNSNQKCLKHYARPDLTPEQGQEWFQISPSASTSGTVVPMSAAV